MDKHFQNYFMSKEPIKLDAKNARRTLIASIGTLSLFPLLKLGIFSKKREVISCAPEAPTRTVKMLTQEGLLVEVDISKLKGDKHKISNKQLQTWIKKEM